MTRTDLPDAEAALRRHAVTHADDVPIGEPLFVQADDPSGCWAVRCLVCHLPVLTGCP